jgi:FixJ family two-component response regulator
VKIHRALQAGASGYLLKNMPPSELLDVIRLVHAGKKRIPPEIASQLAEHMADEALTEREVEVLQQVAGGNKNRDIAKQALHLRRNRESPYQAHHGKIGCCGSNPGSRHRHSARNHSTLSSLPHHSK